MVLGPMNERDLYITADGTSYQLSAPSSRFVLSVEGEGMPPIQYVTQRGAYQHGDTARDFFLLPRIVQMVVRHTFCDRTAYWAGRTELLNLLRPNRGGTPGIGTLRKILPGGVIRDLRCVIQQGPNFAPRNVGIGGNNVWDEFAYTETLRFVADNPIYYDPKGNTTIISTPSIGTFPLTFPWVFPVHTFTTNITYGGNWDEYPTIAVKGPFTAITLTNTTTGETINFGYPVVIGQTVTFTLTFGLKTVTLQDGTNLIGYVTVPGNLPQWHLTPGVNTIFTSIAGEAASTQVTFTYFNRYIGI